MKPRKEKCPICGNYTLSGLGSICPVCFWEDGRLKKTEELKKAKETYKKIKASDESYLQYVREPRGIELPGLYEPDNFEAQNNQQYLFTKSCYENNVDIDIYNAANHMLLSSLFEGKNKEDNEHKEVSNFAAFSFFNALAYKDDYIGLKSAFNLALCYASGCGCKKDLLEAQAVLDEIMSYFDVNYSKG